MDLMIEQIEHSHSVPNLSQECNEKENTSPVRATEKSSRFSIMLLMLGHGKAHDFQSKFAVPQNRHF
jgi:hypothetical protein